MNLVNKTVIRKEKGVKLKEGDLLDTHSTLNIIINKLYKNLDAKDKIINDQALEIARLKEKINKATELTKNLLKTENRGYYQILFKEQLKVLGEENVGK